MFSCLHFVRLLFSCYFYVFTHNWWKMCFPRALAQSEMQTVSSRIWPQVKDSISNHYNHYTKSASLNIYKVRYYLLGSLDIFCADKKKTAAINYNKTAKYYFSFLVVIILCFYFMTYGFCWLKSIVIAVHDDNVLNNCWPHKIIIDLQIKLEIVLFSKRLWLL